MYDAAYIPDLSYAAVGLEGVAILGYCRMGAYLGIVKEQHPQDSSVFLRSAELDSEGEAVFPIRAALAGVSLAEPEVVQWMSESLKEEIEPILGGIQR